MAPRLLFLVLLSLLLAACNRNPFEVVVSRCPAVAVVGDTATWTEFKEGVRRRTQDTLVFTASISDVEVSCSSDGEIVSSVDFSVLARAYDAHDGSSITLPYFVAVLKDNNQLITKRLYEVTLDFDQDGLARIPQRVVTEVPSIEQARSYNYEILVGFQADPADIYYNLVR